MSGRIFLNYRRGDEPGFALALYARLEPAFPAERLFMDVEGGIAAGDDFVTVLETQVAQCDVLLALIGQGWLSAADETGARRLDNPNDFVRIEIESALRLGKRVIPVLVNKAEMPRAADLPEPMQPLARRNALRLTQERFRSDVQGLIAALERPLADAQAARETASNAAAEALLRQQQAAAAKAEEAQRIEKERTRLDAIAGLSPDQIAKAEELANWDFIKASERAQEFRDHLARFPAGVTERFARTRLEAVVWDDLGPTPDLAHLADFLAEFPGGAHTAEAADRQAALARDRDAERAAAARRRQETEAWAAASGADDAAQLEAFLAAWPQSEHAKAARARIKSLKDSPSRRRWLIGAGSAAAAAAGGLVFSLRPGEPLWRWLNETSIATFRGHSNTIRRIAISRDGSKALSGSDDRTAKLWDLATGRAVQTFAGHSEPVLGVALSPDGRNVLSASADRSFRLWDVATGGQVRTFTGYSETVTSVMFLPDGLTALSCSWDRTLRQWEMATGRQLRLFQARTPIANFALTADGSSAVSTGWDGAVTVWDVATAKELRSFTGHTGSVTAIALTPDGRTALSAGHDGIVRAWEVATAKQIRAFDKTSSIIDAVACSPDGRTVMASSYPVLTLWDIATGKKRGVIGIYTASGDPTVAYAATFTPNGTILAGVANDLKLWDMKTL